MKTSINEHDLPNDVEALKALVLQLQSKLNQQIIEIDCLREKLHKQLLARFGRKSEKDLNGIVQLSIFDEAQAQDEQQAESIAKADESITVAAYERKKSTRKPLPKELPREQMIHDLAAEEKVCACGGALHKIGEDKSEQLEWVPAQVKVIEHIRMKYGCRHCEEGVKTATLPAQPIPKSIATPGLLAEIMVSKFNNHLPLYRQEKILQNMGVDICRATLSTWMLKAATIFLPLINVLKEHMLAGHYMQVDETTTQVMKELGRENTSTSYMWVFKGGPPGQHGVIFQYHPTRSGEVAANFLGDFQGALQCDGFSGYYRFDGIPRIALYYCWAHARRYFADIVKSLGKNKRGKAHVAIDFIARLYGVEKRAREKLLNFDQRQALRQQESLPVLLQFKEWLDKSVNEVPPQSAIGRAIAYTLNHWHYLVTYINNGEIEIDNNLVENMIRPFALGRRNWLFFGSPEGAKAGSVIYSLLQTCKLHVVEPYAYFKYLLSELPKRQPQANLSDLLPQFIDKALLLPAYSSSFLE